MNEHQEQEQQEEEQLNKIIRNVLKCYLIVGNSRSIIFINKCSSNEKQFFMKIKNFQSFNLNIKIEDTCSGCCCC